MNQAQNYYRHNRECMENVRTTMLRPMMLFGPSNSIRPELSIIFTITLPVVSSTMLPKSPTCLQQWRHKCMAAMSKHKLLCTVRGRSYNAFRNEAAANTRLCYQLLPSLCVYAVVGAPLWIRWRAVTGAVRVVVSARSPAHVAQVAVRVDVEAVQRVLVARVEACQHHLHHHVRVLREQDEKWSWYSLVQ